METLAYKKGDAEWGRLSRFFGRLFLINIAVGVVTGIVLEFQVGLNWSSYSVFVGNIRRSMPAGGRAGWRRTSADKMANSLLHADMRPVTICASPSPATS
jgi:hypothetical protein